MKGTRRIVGGCALVAVLAGTTVSAPTAGAAGPGIMVLLEGLSSPKGVSVDLTGNPVVAQGAFGPPGPVLIYRQSRRGRGQAEPLTGPFPLVDIAVSPLDNTGWAIGFAEVDQEEHVVLYHRLADGSIEMPLDITAYQVGDPDPDDQDDFAEESNPYGLAVLPSGDALVADAAGNDLIRVTPGGDAVTVARFDLELVSTDHLGPDSGLPPQITAEAVPTTVAIGPDGAIYVGELKGFPFRPGTSHIWRIEPDAAGAFCSTTTPDPDCSVHLEGFTGIQDIAFNPNNGRLYVYELAAEGVLAFEGGFDTGDFPPAVLLEVKPNGRTEIATGQLSEPGGVAVARDGRVYVTDGIFTDGRLVRVVR